jgi:hypothetical protein
MFWIPILLALLSAVIITAISSLVFRWKGPWDNVWAYFAILFIACWSASLWVEKSSPSVEARSWVPLGGFVVLLVFGLVLSVKSRRLGPQARIPVKAWRDPSAGSAKTPSSTPEDVTLGVFFWALLGLLLLSVIWGIYFRSSLIP